MLKPKKNGLGPRRRAGDAVGDPRELVLDRVRRQVVLLRRPTATATATPASTPGHPAPPRSQAREEQQQQRWRGARVAVVMAWYRNRGVL
uniref:Uncharacterized protein n=1 Tax=Arundo donax TaxID=35708 RepID=A0A0A9FTV0_ARUDO